jgi:AmpE protein
MSATLIAVVAALVLAQAAPAFAASVRRYGWYAQWVRWLGAQLGDSGTWRSAAAVALVLLPPVLALALLQRALDGVAFGLPRLLLDIAVLFHVWGPRDLDADVEAVADARDTASRRAAASWLWPRGATPVLEGGALVEAVFGSALRRWFGVLLWFLLLGPAGALGYRLAALAVDSDAADRLASEARGVARRVLAWLEWPVAQFMTISLALVGNFDAVLAAWRKHGGASLRPDRRFLAAAARASVRCELAEEAADAAEDSAHEGGSAIPPPVFLAAADAPELRDAMSLVWRCLLVWLAVLALFVIAGWVS